MKILIVEDSRANRLLLVRSLEKNGYEVIGAEDGAQGVAMFNSEAPDLILMDLMMPVMDGYMATRTIKELSGEKFTPIIVLTALTDTDSLIKAIEYGADDYLTKPYNIEEIHAKIMALCRIMDLHETINKNRKELLRNKEKVEKDISVAKHICENVLNNDSTNSAFINNRSFSSSTFTGEILLFAHTPSGDMHLFIGEISGHGMGSAIGAIPISEAFYSMSEKGFSIADIAHELNSKLKTVLPEYMCCKSCLIEIDKNRTAIGVWNSGMPDVVIRGPREEIIKSYRADKKALGRVADSDFDRQLEIIQVAGNEKIYVCNDKLFELMSDSDKEFSSSQYMKTHESLVFEDANLDSIIDAIKPNLNSDLQGSGASLVEICLDKRLDNWSADRENNNKHFLPPSKWSINVCFDASCLKSINPVPALLNIIMNIQAPGGHKERIFTILSELFNNAQEHGLLGMDSALKQSPAGFSTYYTIREKRLADLEDGEISVSIQHVPSQKGGSFIIVMTDSGPGFDHDKPGINISNNTSLAGRGMPLIRSLCDELTYNEEGNQATAVYSWGK